MEKQISLRSQQGYCNVIPSLPSSSLSLTMFCICHLTPNNRGLQIQPRQNQRHPAQHLTDGENYRDLKSLSRVNLKRVEDFKYQGSWIMDPEKDFKSWKVLAWVAQETLALNPARRHQNLPVPVPNT